MKRESAARDGAGAERPGSVPTGSEQENATSRGGVWESHVQGRRALTELAVLPGESRLAGAGARGGVAVVAGAGVGAAPAPAAAAAGCRGKRGHIQHPAPPPNPAALLPERIHNAQNGAKLPAAAQGQSVEMKTSFAGLFELDADIIPSTRNMIICSHDTNHS